VGLSAALYVTGLGFYSDDWTVVGYAGMSADQTFMGIFRAIYGDLVQMRPVQFLYLAGLYKVFGLDPLGYHVVNTLVLAAGAVLFYLVLRELREPRVLALTVPLVYALLPHYSADRFWVAAFQATLSMTLFFLCLYADLKAWRPNASPSRRLAWGLDWRWKAVSVAALLSSALAYEVFLPLFLFSPVLVGYAARQRASARPRSVGVLASFAPNLLALGAVALFKVRTTSRADFGADDPVYHIEWFAKLVKSSAEVGFVELGLALPFRLHQIAGAYFDGATFVVGGALGALVFLYLSRVAEPSALPSVARAVAYGAAGLVLFVAGYAVFLTNYNALVTATGIANRVAIAGAVGVALCFAAGAGGISALFRSTPMRRWVFCAIVAFLAGGGLVVNATVASFWVEAYDEEQRVLAAVQNHFPVLPQGSTVLIDGLCPYVGPAVVFESSWDLAGALMLRYRDYALRADVLTPTSEVEDEGISTSIYGGAIYTLYPYGENVYVYDYRRDASTPLPNAGAARRYFESAGIAEPPCPAGSAGYGVPIF